MNRFCATYGNNSNLLVDLEVSLPATITPPYENVENQVINCDHAVNGHFWRYDLAYCAWRNAFLCVIS